MGFQVKGKDEMVFIECRCLNCDYSEYRWKASECIETVLCTKFRRLVSGNFFCKMAKRKEVNHEQK